MIDEREDNITEEDVSKEEEEQKESRFTKDRRVKKEKYYLNGTAMTVDGKMTKTDYFKFLEIPLDDYSELSYTPKQIARIRSHIMNMRSGLQAMAPMFCGGPIKCPIIFRCPFRQQHEMRREDMDPKNFPVGRQCIIEREFLIHKRREYFQEYDVDVDSPTEIGLINKLAELDMYEYRATLILAHGDDGTGGIGQNLLKEQVIAVTPQGNELKRTEIHPAWELKEKIQKQRMDILQALVGTRREQYKKQAATKQSEFNDPSNRQSDLMKKLDNLMNKQDTVIDVEVKDIEPKKKEEKDGDSK